MPAPKMLSGLPKPLLFGLYGAVGGLLGAVLLGELAWFLLKPPPAPEQPPQVAVAASPSVQVYPGSENTFPVKIERQRFDGPVTVTFESPFPAPPPGEPTLPLPKDAPPDLAASPLDVPKLVIPAGETGGTGRVKTNPLIPPGEYKVTMKASNADGTVTAVGEPIVVKVVPTPLPPPAIALAVPSALNVYKKGTGQFRATLARRNFNEKVTVTVGPLPPGVTAAPAEIPSGADFVDVTLSAADTADLGDTKLTVTAEAPAAKLKATAPTAVTVAKPPVAPVDVVFVLDVTASMQWAIDDLKNGIGKFADTLSKNQITFRMGLVTFRDLTVAGETIDVIKFGDKAEPFTSDAAAFREKSATIRASGGGDLPESSLEAIAEAAKLPFEQKHGRVLLLITDAAPKVPGGTVAAAVDAAAAGVKEKGIDSVHIVVQRFDHDAYKPLTTAGVGKFPGKYFNLGDVVRGDDGFDGLLDTFSKEVTAAALARAPDSKPVVAPAPAPPTLAAAAANAPKASEAAPAPSIKSLQGGDAAAAGSEGILILRSGVWAGAVAALICLVLLAGQHHYLRGSLPGAGGLLAGIVGGLVVGLAGGAAGQGLYLMAPGSEAVGTAFRVLGWTLLGGLAGAGLSFFIPNMKWFLGLAGGAIGGAVGAAGFIAVSAVAGDLVGRVVGGLLLGFCIGLMVAIVEAAFRRAWLEVRYGARETVTVTLGPEPVKVGGDAKMCTVWARGAAPLALRFFVRDGKVICDDAAMKREVPVGDGYAKEVGNVTVTVRTGAGGGSAPPAPPPPPPRSSDSPASSRRAASDDDDFDLPMPMSPPPARPAAASPPPPPARQAPAPAPKPAAPAPRPAAPTASKPAMPAVPPPAPRPASPPPPPRPVAPPAASKPAMPAVPPKPPAPAPKPATPAAPKPAAPAAGKNPNGCPGCGRVVEGKPKQRYCMVCDNTF